MRYVRVTALACVTSATSISSSSTLNSFSSTKPTISGSTAINISISTFLPDASQDTFLCLWLSHTKNADVASGLCEGEALHASLIHKQARATALNVPLQPTTIVTTSVSTGHAPNAPLRPATMVTMTVSQPPHPSTDVDTSPHGESSTSLDCSGVNLPKNHYTDKCIDGAYLWASGNDFTKYMCGHGGKTHCNSMTATDCGYEEEPTSSCSEAVKCNFEGENAQRAEVIPETKAVEYHTVQGWALYCIGADMDSWDRVSGCPNDKDLYLSGLNCQDDCSCTEKGDVSCSVPENFCDDNNMVTKYCQSAHPEWFTCSCKASTKEGTANKLLANRSPSTSSESVDHDLRRFGLTCQGSDLKKEICMAGCLDGVCLKLSGDDCDKHCSCNDSGEMTCHVPDQYCAEDSLSTDFCKAAHSRFQCSCNPQKLVDPMNITMRVLESLVSSPESKTTHRPPHRRTPLNTCLHCDGDNFDKTLDVVTCDSDGSVLKMSGHDCSKQCSCTDSGDMICDSPRADCGTTYQITQFCIVQHTEFTCICSVFACDTSRTSIGVPMSNPVAAPEQARVEATTADDRELTVQDRKTVTSFHLVCEGSDMNKQGLATFCITQDWFLSGNGCAKICSCSEIGQMACNHDGGCDDPTPFCETESHHPWFDCQCVPSKEERTIEASSSELLTLTTGQRGIITAYSHLQQPTSTLLSIPYAPDYEKRHVAGNPLLCSGTDLKETYYVGVCTDGMLMYWSGSDCQDNCKCDDSGKLSCEVASDCGPADKVAEACAKEVTFTCVCLQEHKRDEAAVSELASSQEYYYHSHIAPPSKTHPIHSVSLSETRIVPPSVSTQVNEKRDIDGFPPIAPGSLESYPGTAHSTKNAEIMARITVPQPLDPGPANKTTPHDTTPFFTMISPLTHLATTLTTSTRAAFLSARDSYDLYCAGDLNKHVDACTGNDGTGRYVEQLHGLYCQRWCTCGENGCINCQAGPDVPDSCGGATAVTRFCRQVQQSFTCACRLHGTDHTTPQAMECNQQS